MRFQKMGDQMSDRIREIEDKRAEIRLGGGPKEIEKQHRRGRLTARERIEKLLDSGSFREFDLWAKPLRTGFPIDEKSLYSDGVVTGYGEIDGRPIFIYAHDFTAGGATQAAVYHSKITRVMDMAVRMKVPYIGLVDSGGWRIQDAMGFPGWQAPVAGYGQGGTGSIMYSPSNASGVIPQISVMLGPNYAGSCYSPIMADFLIMGRGTYMSLVSPSVIKEATHVEVTQEEIGGALLHAEVSGTCDIVVENDEEGLERCRQLLSLLPSNNEDKPPIVKTGDDANRRDQELLSIVPTDLSQGYDMREIIRRTIDNGQFFEIKPLYAKNVITGFARVDGKTAGIVANNPSVLGGAVDRDSSDKEARFIRFCDAFNIPLIFLVDTVGYLSDANQERLGLERHAAKASYAICEATVPKITIYIGNCRGSGELAMCTEQMGGDLVLAWPSARIGGIDPVQAVDTLYAREIKKAKNPDEIRQRRIKEFAEKYNSIYSAAARQLMHDIIDPRDTRPIIAQALIDFTNKRDFMPRKKHGNIPL